MIGDARAPTDVPSHDFFLDLPHPNASDKSLPNGRMIIGAPPQNFTDSETVCKELTTEKNLGHITRLAFPDYSDKYHGSLQVSALDPTSGGLNKFDMYAKGFQSHSFKFTIQSSLGLVVGHVRTYLPTHKHAKGRADVGRRGNRALVLLTRKTNNDKLCSSILKTAEAIIMQKTSCPIPPLPSTSLEIFLHSVLLQQFLLQEQQQQQQQQSQIISIPGIEFGQISEYLPFDQYFFIPPPPSSAINSKPTPMMPLLRCLGPNNVVRLLSALMCERRIIFLSKSPTRLSQCVSSATALLESGMLSWPHIIIPVLPPHQFPALGTKVKPYIVGVVTKCARDCRIDQISGVEDVVMFDLDQTGFVRLLGGGGQNLDRVVPDLLKVSLTDGNPNYVPLGQVLAQDLAEVHKNDKFKYTSNLAAAVQNIAKKSGDTLKNVARSIGRFAASRRNIQNSSSIEVPEPSSASSSEHDETPIEMSNSNILEDGHVLMENELGEDDFNTALVSFYLNLLGGGSWYISNTGSGLIPDVNKYVDERRKRGDTQGTAMYPLVYFFVQTKIFQNFAHARIAEKRTAMRPSVNSPFMFKCTDYISRHQLNYAPFDVRRIVKQMTQNSPRRQQIVQNEALRRLTISLTSNRPYEGNASDDISKLTKACRVTTTKLADVMDILWMRLRNGKSQWKPALLSLYILRNLILHGPITAISEAMTGLEKIRELKKYQSSNKANSAQVQTTAKNIYSLLVDRSRLFMLRRAYATRRKAVSNNKPSQLRKVTELKSAPTFRQLHQFVQPKNQSGVVNIKSSDLLGFSNTTPATSQQSKNASYANDLLSFDFTDNSTATNPNPTAQTASNNSSSHSLNNILPPTSYSQQKPEKNVANSLDIFSGLQQSNSQNTTPFDATTNESVQNQNSKPIPLSNIPQQPYVQPSHQANPFDSAKTSQGVQSSDAFDLGSLTRQTESLANASQNPFVTSVPQATQPSYTSVSQPQQRAEPMSAQSAIGTSVQGTQYAMNPQQQQVYSQRQIGANNLYHGQNGQPYYNTASPYQTNQNVNNNQQHQSLVANPQSAQKLYQNSQQQQRNNFQSERP